MKLLLGVAIFLLPSALCPLPSSALEINFDSGDRVEIDEYSVSRRLDDFVSYSQTIYLANESFKIRSYGWADCNRKVINMSQTKYYTLDEDFIGYDNYDTLKISVKPNTIFEGILETVCSLEGYDVKEF